MATRASISGPVFFKGLIPFLGDKPRLEDYVKALQEEKRKITAFQRELPFCMQLLNEAIEASKEQLTGIYIPAANVEKESCEKAKKFPPERPFLEDFFPLKHRESCDQGDAIADEFANRGVEKWDCSLGQSKIEENRQEGLIHSIDKAWLSIEKQEPLQRQDSDCDPIKPYTFHSQRREGGAFSSFTKAIPSPPGGSQISNVTISQMNNEDLECLGRRGEERRDSVKRAGSVNNQSNQSQRKPRRFWSRELHCQFLSALQKLGGPQVATPKQIRGLMKVEGLTNAEIKSHLQKYRLHKKRLNLTPTATIRSPAGHTPELVLLGGIWVPTPEYNNQ